MLQSMLFPRTLQKEDPKDEIAPSAQLLIRGGYISKLGAGIYSLLPLGWQVIQRIASIIREEMASIGGQELFLPALHPAAVWEETGRWEEAKDVMYRFEDSRGHKWGLGFTHEEIITDIVRHRVSSFRDLPFYLYQIQTKFRNEPRPTSGLLRAREFIMKDLYSFHASEEDREIYYKKVAEAYRKIFSRCGLEAIYTEASGGLFSPRSHEFQVLSEVGEDTIFYCPQRDYAFNREIYKNQSCPNHPKEKLQEGKAIEVGNIFPLGTRFSGIMGANFLDSDGKKKPIVMGSYGIGLGRTLATAVEISHDAKGIIWPFALAPFQVHLVALASASSKETEEIFREASGLYLSLQKHNIMVLYDDRKEVSAGEKFAEADLLGAPLRVLLSAKTVAKGSVEVKERTEKEGRPVKYNEAIDVIKTYVQKSP